MTEDLLSPISFARGPAWPNRMALAPLTNKQSHDDGTLSEAEQRWLVMRAQGGFGLTMTCAAHVQAVGQGFPGQLGVFDDRHVAGLKGLADAIRAHGSVSSLQLHHAGNRADRTVVPAPVGASDDAESGARALSTAEVEALRDDFIAGARRAEAAGFDGVEVHGAHGYVLAQFLSAEVNRREDRYGGTFANRSRLVIEILEGIRAACGPDFQLGLRVSPERFGMQLPEIVGFVADLMAGDTVDYVDLSLWDFRKLPEDPAFQDRSLLGHFVDLPRHKARLGGAGKMRNAADAREALDAGLDFVMYGRSAILTHDIPNRIARTGDYQPPKLPVSPAHLAAEGLSPIFIEYMRDWRHFVADETEAGVAAG